MLLLYISIGGILGLLILGPIGMLFGIALGLAFSIAQSAEKRTIELESKIQQLEFKHNDDLIHLKTLIKNLEEKQNL